MSAFQHRFKVGTVDGETLVLTAELKPKTGRAWGKVTNANGATVRGLVEASGSALSICGAVFNTPTGRDSGGGQCLDTLRAVIEHGTLVPNLTPDRAGRIFEAWERWHLNDMTAGCVHQRAEGWDTRPIDPEKPTNAYGKHFPGQQQDSWNMLTWVRRAEHPAGLMSEPCPTCGYRYGTAWLFEPLPAEVEAFIRGLADLPASGGTEVTGETYARSTLSVKMRAEQVDRNPNMPGGEGDHWRCVLSHGKSRLTVYFTKGYGHNGKEPSVREVLGCLASDAASYENAGSFEAWANELGMGSDSRSAERTYRAVERQTEGLKRLLGADFSRALEMA